MIHRFGGNPLAQSHGFTGYPATGSSIVGGQGNRIPNVGFGFGANENSLRPDIPGTSRQQTCECPGNIGQVLGAIIQLLQMLMQSGSSQPGQDGCNGITGDRAGGGSGLSLPGNTGRVNGGNPQNFAAPQNNPYLSGPGQGGLPSGGAMENRLETPGSQGGFGRLTPGGMRPGRPYVQAPFADSRIPSERDMGPVPPGHESGLQSSQNLPERPQGPAYRARGTGYYPANTRMEGGYFDRKGKPLQTLQAYLAGKAPYVSVAMDKNAFRYGQRLRIPELEQKYGRSIDFRVVDTGGAFKGKGTSRIDIATANSQASKDSTINGPLTLIPQD